MNEFDELRAAAESATPGPWRASNDGVTAYVHNADVGDLVGEFERRYLNAHMVDPGNDATYIAAASPDVVLGLLDRLEAAEARVAAVRAAVDDEYVEMSHNEVDYDEYVPRWLLQEALDGPPDAQPESDPQEVRP